MKKIFKMLLCSALSAVMVFSSIQLSAGAFVESQGSAAIIVYADDSDEAKEESFFSGIIALFRSIFFSTISFDTDGGSEISDICQLKFSKVSAPENPTKEGYSFAGWDSSIPPRMPWNSLTLKAQWTANRHSVFWVIDGLTVKTETYSYGETIEDFIPTEKEGYTFSSWLDNPDIMPDSDVTITGTYTKLTEFVVTESDDEFNEKASALVSATLNDEDFNPDEARANEYYTCRIVANCSDFSLVDFTSFEADTVIMNDDGTMILQFSNSDLAESCKDYLDSVSAVTFAEADVYVEVPDEVEIEEIPEMPSISWGERYINADKYAYYLENNRKDSSLIVAVVDTGIDTDHPFLAGRVLSSGKNCINNSNEVEDDVGHGTHVSGIIVNCTNNLNVKIMPVKSLSASGGSLISIVSGIKYAASNGARVINLSLESKYNIFSKYIESAIDYAVEKGCVVVVAAGNGEAITHEPVNTANVCPANVDNSIVVGALDENGNKGYFSNYGDSVDVSAPGVNIVSSSKNGGYAMAAGTSQAAPHIAAVAAMFRIAYPSYTPAQIEAIIKQYCVDKGPAGRDEFYGEGCPNMYDAIPDCTIDFNSNGGSLVNSSILKNSSSITLPTPSKSYSVTFNANGGWVNTTNYTSTCTFNGWFTTSSLTGQSYSGGESYMLLKDSTMYAKWTDNRLNLSSVTASRTGFRFVGWFTAPSGGQQCSGATVISSNMTIYAHWEQYALYFNMNGGQGGPSTQYGYGSTTISSYKPERSGYLFLGWSESSSASSATYRAGGSISLTYNRTLYAVWGKIEVILSSYSGSEYMAASVDSGVTWSGFPITLPSVTLKNIPGNSLDTRWEVMSGNATVSGGTMYISQPGTVKVRYNANGYYSDPYTYTLSLYKITSATNTIRSSASDAASSVGTVPANTRVNILEVNYNGTYKGNRAAWGKVTYGGNTGWIILFS